MGLLVGKVVDVELDLFDTSRINIGRNTHAVQLLVGPLLSKEAAAPVLDTDSTS